MPAPRIPFFSPETTAIFDIGVAAYSFLGFCCGSAGKESAGNTETWVQSLSWEDPLEKGKATCSSILAWT